MRNEESLSDSNDTDVCQAEQTQASPTASEAIHNPPKNQPQGDIMGCLKTIISLLQSIDHKLSGSVHLAEPSQNEAQETTPAPMQAVKKEQEIATPPTPPEKVEIPAELLSLAQEFKPWQALCQKIVQDNELAELLIASNYADIPTARQLIYFFANAAQWDKVVALRELLGARCKQEQRPAHALEQQLLEECLKVHNLIWKERQAKLLTAEVGSAFDVKKHERGISQGEQISAVWLAGLRNAGDTDGKKVLVATR